MERFVRIAETLDAGGRVFHPGSVIDTLKYPETVPELERRRPKRVGRESPLNKMRGGPEVAK